MKKSLIVTIASVLALGFAAYAGEGKGPGPGGPGEHKRGDMPLLPPRVAEKLNLTDAQKAQVKDLNDKFDKERDQIMAGKKDQMKSLGEQRHAAKEAGDEAKVKEVSEQMRALMEPVMALRKQHMEQVKAILTDAQKKQLEEMRENHKERGEGRGPGGPPPKKQK